MLGLNSENFMALDLTYGRLEWKENFTYKDVQKHWRKNKSAGMNNATWKLLNHTAVPTFRSQYQMKF